MRAVVQRVKSAGVKVDNELVGHILKGHLVFLGVEGDDTHQDLEYLVDKVLNLRVFEDEDGKLNKSVLDIEGSLLVVSQFTLYGDCRRGRRPSFSKAASPDDAKAYYENFIALAKERGIKVECGVFQAQMDVELVNDGPVTLLIDSKKNF